MTAINNLRAGLAPPVTGSDNHEMWSDGAAMRIAPVGILCAGDPREAARLAAIEHRSPTPGTASTAPRSSPPPSLPR